MGLKEAQDGFLKAHGELAMAMGQEAARMGEEVTAVDEELAQLCKLLECSNEEHAEYELEMFKQVRAASKAHDEKVLHVSQQIELKRKRKEQLSKSLQCLLRSSLADLALSDNTQASAQGGKQLAQQHAQPDPGVIDSDPAAASGHQQMSAGDVGVVVKLETSFVQPEVEEPHQPVTASGGRGRSYGGKRGRGRRKSGVLATTPKPQPHSPKVNKVRKVRDPKVAGGSSRGAPGSGRYFLRRRPTGSPTPMTESVMIVLN